MILKKTRRMENARNVQIWLIMQIALVAKKWAPTLFAIHVEMESMWNRIKKDALMLAALNQVLCFRLARNAQLIVMLMIMNKGLQCWSLLLLPKHVFYNRRLVFVALANFFILMELMIIYVTNVKTTHWKTLMLVFFIDFYYFLLALSFMSLCKECSSHNVCTECDASKILRNDLTGCVSSCSEDTSAALTGATYKVPNYHATAT